MSTFFSFKHLIQRPINLNDQFHCDIQIIYKLIYKTKIYMFLKLVSEQIDISIHFKVYFQKYIYKIVNLLEKDVLENWVCKQQSLQSIIGFIRQYYKVRKKAQKIRHCVSIKFWSSNHNFLFYYICCLNITIIIMLRFFGTQKKIILHYNFDTKKTLT